METLSSDKRGAAVDELNVRVEERSGALVVVLTGNVGMREAEPLNRALTRVLARRPHLTVIDLSAVAMLASIAMGALIAYAGGVRLQGGQLRVVANGYVLESLKRARLDQVLGVQATVEAVLGETSVVAG